ncbi:MAG: hypothetical protein AAFR11_10275 [Pseudomonadota bacterium]
MFISLMTAGLATAASAQDANRLLEIRISGDRGWVVSCTLDRGDDAPVEATRRGRGDIETIAARGVLSGSCDYSGPTGSGDMKIVFTDENFPEKCPFRQEAGRCVGRFGADETGTFSF